MEASAKAYKTLSDHSKHKTKQWLQEDLAAQKDRQVIPSLMDIYDTVKQKGVDTEPGYYSPGSCIFQAPSCAAIQQQLIVEESRDHSIRGQTTWISCGLKIQEMQ